MDVSELRKRILHAIDGARKDAATRRQRTDEASAAYAKFLADVASPLFLQASMVLRAAQHEFTAETPAGSVRLAGARPSQGYVELALDVIGGQPTVIGRTGLPQRGAVVIEERPIAAGKAIADITDEDVSAFLVAELPRLVTK